MSKTYSRRDILKLLGVGIALSSGIANSAPKKNETPPKVVIIGGGFGGSSAAKYLRFAHPTVEITLVDSESKYISCIHSNDVITNHIPYENLINTHDNLRKKYNIKTVYSKVVGYNKSKKLVILENGTKLPYDKLIVSPGVDFIYDGIDGYNQEIGNSVMPHAWKAGPQTLQLQRALGYLPQGGTWLMVAPPIPYRCPPGPYERVSLICDYFKKHNPTAKVIILDPKDTFTKDAPFKKGWERLYGYGTNNSMIDWVSKSNGGEVLKVKAKEKIIVTASGDYKADFINFIPKQKAANLAFELGLTDSSGWCPIDRNTFSSSIDPDVFVIGDACIADSMPKSGYAANSQAKVAVQAIADILNGQEPGVPSMLNSCYSFVGEEYGISIVDIFQVKDGKIVKTVSSGVSPITDNLAQPKLEALYMENWHRTFIDEVFN